MPVLYAHNIHISCSTSIFRIPIVGYPSLQRKTSVTVEEECVLEAITKHLDSYTVNTGLPGL